jgi:hypothetical protein
MRELKLYRLGSPAYMLKSKTRSKTYCHMPHSSGHCHPAKGCSGAATCSTALDLTSFSGELRHYHMSHGSGPYLPAREGLGTATCPTALDPASLLKRALTLPHVPWLWTLPPCLGGLQCCHVFRCSGPCLLLGRASALPHAPQLRSLSPYSGRLERCHVSHGSQCAMGLRNKERPSWSRHAARLACFQGTLARYRGACKTCGQAASS